MKLAADSSYKFSLSYVIAPFSYCATYEVTKK